MAISVGQEAGVDLLTAAVNGLVSALGPQPCEDRSPEATEWLNRVQEMVANPANWREGEPLKDRLERMTAAYRASEEMVERVRKDPEKMAMLRERAANRKPMHTSLEEFKRIAGIGD